MPAASPALSPASLRLRVLAAIALVVVLGAVCGAAFAGFLARAAVRDELQAAMAGGRARIERMLAARPDAAELTALVRSFDGDRHVVASLEGSTALASQPAPSRHPAPGWFVALLDPHVASATYPAGGASLRLAPAPADDVGDVWLQFTDALIVLGLVGVAGAALVFVTIGRALRPLSELTAAFARVGAGDYGARVAEAGPAELARLSASFNAMTGELETMRRRTRVLEEQILKLQDEERAELARDLHDEIGPQLFAANIDAAMLGQALAAGRKAEASRLVGSIQAAVGHLQRQVRDILGRLRPAQLVELGLTAAVGELVAFWEARRPDIAFVVDLGVDDAALPDAVQEAAYRIVQEALSNAVRHGQPGRIAVSICVEGGQAVVEVRDDGLGERGAEAEAGFGLRGMRERIEALGGSLSVQSGAGWAVVARAPLAGAEPVRAAS